jgi:hypothetical protein
MADGDPIIIGQDNTASNETSLSRDENTAAIVFVARNLNEGDGIHGESNDGIGVQGTTGGGVAGPAAGVRGINRAGEGVGVVGRNEVPGGLAGLFFRNVQVSNGNLDVIGITDAEGNTEGGDINCNGDKPFKIDHPLDPKNKYLLHTAVESPERKNVYDGVAWLDKDGAAWVELPEWFEALNKDFHYQLTAIGGAAPELHVAEEISDNRFRIAGGEEGMKVCWHVTGVRNDPWAAARPFEVEQEKGEEERGRYLVPSLYDAPEEQKVPMLWAASTTPTGEEEASPEGT